MTVDLVIKNDLCIGCGLCTYKCPNKALEMKWNDFGFLVPKLTGHCDLIGDCITVCPFNPFPEKEVETENKLAELFINDVSLHHSKIGNYQGIYAGYADEFRLTSSSGGIATYILTELLENKIVEYVFSVNKSTKPGIHYEYSISATKKELIAASKTRYFPVTLSNVFSEIDRLDGKVAIVGVACFIKAIRLAQHSEPSLKEKIPFLVGIICGGVKSRFFTEYLAGKADVSIENIQKPQFRIKDLNSTASDYSFGCYDIKNKKEKEIKMSSVGDMWGTGLFKANACDFCDDVTTELADISIGDAWIEPYLQDGKGTNIVVTRSLVAEEIIHKGINNSNLHIEKLQLELFLASQKGSFNHRHNGLTVRIKQAKKHNIAIPPKRFENEKVTTDFRIIQRLRSKTRQKSLEIWRKQPLSIKFDNKIKINLLTLKWVTRFYHYKRMFKQNINKRKNE